jgi:hypothetical protein
MPASSTPRNKKCGITNCEDKFEDADKAINCRICKKWFHLHCVSLDQEIADFIKNNKGKGIVWKCDNCIFEQPSLGTLLAKISSLEKLVSNKFEVIDVKLSKIYDMSLVEKESDHALTDTKTVSVQTFDLASQITEDTNDENDDALPDFQPEIRNFTCSYYKKGKCRHGSSGKKTIDGKECKYLHPQKCVKYCRYGNSSIRGCNGPCKLLHPIICKNSIQYKSCLSPDCTFAHLAGTKRSRDVNSPEINRGDYYPPSRAFQRNPTFQRDHEYYPHHSGFSKWNQSRPTSNNSRDCAPTLAVEPSAQPSGFGSVSHLSSALNNIQSSVDFLLQRATLNNMRQPQEVVPSPSPLNENNYRGQSNAALPSVSRRNEFSLINPAKNYPPPTLPYPIR